MSVQKLEIVKKSRKDQGHCSKCRTPLPVGSAYQYWYPGFRSSYKVVRCMNCTPRPSERETSLGSTLLAAQEAFHDNVGTLDSPEDIEAAVQEVADAAEEVKGEYEAALDGWENGNEQLQEKVDHYEEQYTELDGWSWDGDTDYTLCSDHEVEDMVDPQVIEDCPLCQANRESWLEECRDAAREVVDSAELA